MVVTENILEKFDLSDPEKAAVRKYCGFPLSGVQEMALTHMMPFDQIYLAGLVIDKISKKIGYLFKRPR